jgi:restriction system protein
MKFKASENSLFAILLRSPWWISIALGAGIVGTGRLMVSEAFAIYAFFAALPFIVIGCVAGWRQLRAPSASRVADTLEAVRAMSWEDFSSALADALRDDGYTVSRLTGAAADFELAKAGRISLVACKRWKAARTGIDPLRDLVEARRAREAHECIYVATGEITDGALAFAGKMNIRLIHGAELAKLLPRVRTNRFDRGTARR